MTNQQIYEILALIQNIAQKEKVECFLVGGTLRDQELNRPTKDLDFAFSFNPKIIAEKVSKELKSSFFALKEEREIYRMILDTGFQLDFAKFKGTTIEEDLSQRDFSINALAKKMEHGSVLLDPYEGKKDLKQKNVRQIHEKIYADDPLRLLRAFRIAAQLNFKIEPFTLETIKKNKEKITTTSEERVREEILLLLDTPHSYPYLLELDQSGLISKIIPESDPNRNCALDYYPGKGVWGHSLDALGCLEWILENLQNEFPKDHEKLKKLLFEEPGLDSHPLATLMKLGALLHDVGKASTAKIIDGRLRFYEHQNIGAKITSLISQRLRFSFNATRHLSQMVLAHMRPGGLAHVPILSDKAKFRFFRDLKSSAIPALIVSLADRYTYLTPQERGQNKDPHEKVVKDLIRWHYEKELEDHANKPKLINGKIIMEQLGLAPGPLIGRILKEIDEAAVLGEIHTEEEALALAKNITKESPPRV